MYFEVCRRVLEPPNIFKGSLSRLKFEDDLSNLLALEHASLLKIGLCASFLTLNKKKFSLKIIKTHENDWIPGFSCDFT